MRDDDDVLRQMFEREARLVPRTSDARTALVAIEPALRRAAIKRAALIAASAALVLGGGVAAFDAVRVDDGALGVVARPTPTESVPPITSSPAVVLPGTSTAPDVTTTDTVDPPVDAGAEPGAPGSPSHVVDDEADTGPRATVGPPPTEPAPPGSVRPVAPEPEPTDTQPSTTAAPTTTSTVPLPPAPVRYDSDCGVVTADLSTSPPTLLEIAPRDGFRVQVEDPDRGRIVVHLAGHDQECEIQVGLPTSEPHESQAAAGEPADD